MFEFGLSKPKVGIPYRTTNEEVDGGTAVHLKYVRAVEVAGGEAVPISLVLDESGMEEAAFSVDAFVLPGSPRDVTPALYRSTHRPKVAPPDTYRERTDYFLLEHAFKYVKPVLAICYGIQILNVFLGGTLVQDISDELSTTIEHNWHKEGLDAHPEPHHAMRVDPDSRLAKLADGTLEVTVNSSHHQSIRETGRNLRVTARAPDGVIEAVEWTGGPEWVTGAQWHPERMAGTGAGDNLSRALFREMLVAAKLGMPT
jgi:putative glutamine amidotransferase